MTVVAPPPQTDADERTLDERVADLEALIEEARQRTRRRRRRNGAVALAALLAAGAALYAGGDDIRAGDARSADDDAASAATLDRAGAWSTPTGPPGFSAGVVLHPTRPGALYLYAGGRVYRSTDGGRSWKSGPPIALKLDALTVDPRHGSILYAGTNDGVLKSTDAGRTWRRSGLRPAPGRSRGYADWEGWVYSIAVDPADSRNVYAVTRGLETRVLFRSRDGGTTWDIVRRTPRAMMEIHAAGSGILYTAGQDWGDSRAEGIRRSTDGGTTWRGVLDGSWSLAVDPHRAGTVWAVGVLGVRVSRDGGTSWRWAGPNPVVDRTAIVLDGSAIVLDPRRPRTLYLSTPQNDVFRSVDGGRTWHPFGAGRRGRSGRAPGLTELLAIDPRKPGTLYAGDGLGVVKTVDGGATWRRADAGVVASHVQRVVPAASNPATIYAAGGIAPRNQKHDFDRILSRSDDRGRTWIRLRTDSGSSLAVVTSVLAVDPRDHRHVLVGGQGITGSHDGGATWTSLHRLPNGWVGGTSRSPRATRGRSTPPLRAGRGPEPPDPKQRRRHDLGRSGAARVRTITTLAVHPKRAETVYAGYEGADLGARRRRDQLGRRTVVATPLDSGRSVGERARGRTVRPRHDLRSDRRRPRALGRRRQPLAAPVDPDYFLMDGRRRPRALGDRLRRHAGPAEWRPSFDERRGEPGDPSGRVSRGAASRTSPSTPRGTGSTPA